MNGKEFKSQTSNIEDQIFFSKEKEKRVKRNLHIRYISILILSNIFLLILYQPESITLDVIKKEPSIRQEYQLLSIPLKLFVPLKGKQQTASSLYDQNHNQIIHKVFIHEKSKRHSNFGDDKSYYDVEIRRSDLEKIIKYKDSILHALPLTKKKSIQRRKKYEIIF